MLEGGSNIRNNVNNACDLGTSALKFKDAYLGGVLNSAGATLTGALVMGANTITTTGAVTGGSFSASLTTASSSTTTGAIVSAGGLGVAGKAYIGDSVLVNTTSATAKIVVSDGVQNIAGYETCIRVSSALTAH